MGDLSKQKAQEEFKKRSKELEEAKKKMKLISDKYATSGSRVPGQSIQPPNAISNNKALMEIQQAQRDVDEAELRYREAIKRLSSEK